MLEKKKKEAKIKSNFNPQLPNPSDQYLFTI